ncbi:MAG: hypothetical protein COW85_05720 [Ignavibacteria bacterium CG22_combo_CG10-13_8_21_14_all_37_15]|nr:MAG: hypothetical protein COW85_05720 [Ignavibacteria bacterium CG22_combo_CG10-13_8_21_14_all_37_15]
MINIKDSITTICAWITVTGGSILTALLSGQITLPKYAVIILVSSLFASVVITQFLTGRNSDGSKKTDSQIIDQMNSK